jgi:hypothetical protein
MTLKSSSMSDADRVFKQTEYEVQLALLRK